MWLSGYHYLVLYFLLFQIKIMLWLYGLSYMMEGNILFHIIGIFIQRNYLESTGI